MFHKSPKVCACSLASLFSHMPHDAASLDDFHWGLGVYVLVNSDPVYSCIPRHIDWERYEESFDSGRLARNFLEWAIEFLVLMTTTLIVARNFIFLQIILVVKTIFLVSLDTPHAAASFFCRLTVKLQRKAQSAMLFCEVLPFTDKNNNKKKQKKTTKNDAAVSGVSRPLLTTCFSLKSAKEGECSEYEEGGLCFKADTPTDRALFA